MRISKAAGTAGTRKKKSLTVVTGDDVKAATLCPDYGDSPRSVVGTMDCRYSMFRNAEQVDPRR